MKKSLLLTGLLFAGLTATAQSGNGKFFATNEKGEEVTYQVTASYNNGKLTVENFNNTNTSLGFNVDLQTGEVKSDAKVVAFVQNYTYEDGEVYMTNTYMYCDVNTTDYIIYGRFINISDEQCALALNPWAIYTDDLPYPKHVAYDRSQRNDNTVIFDFVVEGLPTGSLDKEPDEEETPIDDIEGIWSFEFRSYDQDTYFGKTTVERYKAKYNPEEKTVLFSWESYEEPNGTHHGIRIANIKADYDPATRKIYISENPTAVAASATRTVYLMPVLYTPDWDEPVRTYIDTKFDMKTGTIPVAQYQSLVWLESASPSSSVLMGPMVLRKISKDGFVPSDDPDDPEDPTNPGDEDGVNEITADNSEARYFNLQGIETAHPEKGAIYIKVEGEKTSKIIVK